LHIQSAGGTHARARFTSGGAAGHYGVLGIEFDTTQGQDAPKTSIIANGIGSFGKSDLYFSLRSSNDWSVVAVSADAKMVIKNSGNVGIGTTGPGKKLTVSTSTNNDGIQLVNGSTEIAKIYKTSGGNYGALTLMGPASAVNVRLNADGDSWIRGGDVGIGTMDPASLLHVEGNTVVTGDITSNYSDIRLKENIRPIEDALTKLDTLSGLQFDYKEADESIGYEPFRKSDVGLIAQEVEKVLPDAVSIAPFDKDGDGKSKSGDNYLTLRYERLVPLLVQAIKELSSEVKELKEKINEEE